MDDANAPSPTVDISKSGSAAEATLIAAARAAAAAGKVVDAAQVDAWIDSLGTDHELPAPRSGR